MNETMSVAIPDRWGRESAWETFRELGPVPYPEWGDGLRIRAHVGLHKIAGNQAPHFSATADILGPSGRDEGGGAMLNEITRIWPDTADVCRLHLSEYPSGAPMHSVENGLYWLGCTRYQDYDRDALVRHLRCTRTEADEIRRYVESDPTEHHRETFAYMLNMLGLPDRWRTEAARAAQWITG